MCGFEFNNSLDIEVMSTKFEHGKSIMHTQCLGVRDRTSLNWRKSIESQLYT